MSRLNKKLSQNLFTLPIDHHYQENTNDELIYNSQAESLTNLNAYFNFRVSSSPLEEINYNISTKSNSPFCNIMSNVYTRLNETYKTDDYPTIGEKLKIFKFLKNSWKYKIKKLRNVLSDKLIYNVVINHQVSKMNCTEVKGNFIIELWLIYIFMNL
jgi:hypothetical protein